MWHVEKLSEKRPSWSWLWRLPLTFLYALGHLSHQALFDKGFLRSHYAKVFVLGVGGLEIGGSGKTPVVDFLLGCCQGKDLAVGLSSRGYGRQKSRSWLLKQAGQALSSEQGLLLGDEPWMLAKRYPQVPMVISANRHQAAALLAQHGCRLVLMDDGFGQRSLKVDLQILVLSAPKPFGSGRLLPWGSLRYTFKALQRAHVIWLHSKTTLEQKATDELAQALEEVQKKQKDLKITKPIQFLGSFYRLSADSKKYLSQHKIIQVVCALAKPQSVVDICQQEHATVVSSLFFSDHHRYTSKDVDFILKARKFSGASVTWTTAKDAVKLKALWPDDSLYVLDVFLELLFGDIDELLLHPLQSLWS